MSRVYAHRAHRYQDMASGVSYFFPEKGWVEVPDPIARVVLGGHPDKLVDISDEDPAEAVSRLQGDSQDVDMPEPEPEPVPVRRRRKNNSPRTTPLGTRGRGS